MNDFNQVDVVYPPFTTSPSTSSLFSSTMSSIPTSISSTSSWLTSTSSSTSTWTTATSSFASVFSSSSSPASVGAAGAAGAAGGVGAAGAAGAASTILSSSTPTSSSILSSLTSSSIAPPYLQLPSNPMTSMVPYTHFFGAAAGQTIIGMLQSCLITIFTVGLLGGIGYLAYWIRSRFNQTGSQDVEQPNSDNATSSDQPNTPMSELTGSRQTSSSISSEQIYSRLRRLSESSNPPPRSKTQQSMYTAVESLNQNSWCCVL